MDLTSPVATATKDRLVRRFGPAVGRWWQQVPATLTALAARWALALGEPVGTGNTSLVLRCVRADGTAAILKLTPEPAIADAEARALRAWQPSGRVPGLWGHDARAGAVLLEAVPGEATLAGLGANPGLDAVAELIRALHAVPPIDVPPQPERVDLLFRLWLRRHAADTALVALLERGHALARALAADPVPPVLLHGDLHPGNVLDGGPERGLVAIDPRPCLGDPASDAIDWVFTGPASAWRERARDLAARLDADPGRLWRWCTAFAAAAALGADGERARALLAIAA
ncbi:aminoglycoside phosphotransferase family protein [Prauserella muralis]|uniref:Uncharacterized protein n=1 Tax=Prauserella muralis TaxID=588067 RepID=A0A2V4AHJ0_9PSEU|nr:aminoglycoside phosphotransferase family protein [Prauserella muralis]PXY19329.1 hypothetical protein BAY60_31695 [Prauserella muralis]TWE29281.1 streptomycin 6-kinase [Prauserella muralis]